jgi:hypothetical protein
MGRLIDADAFKRQIAGMTIANSYSVNKANALCELIDAQPIAYDVDAVVKQLEAVDNQIEIQYENNYEKGLSDGIEKAVEIVKGGGVDGN